MYNFTATKGISNKKSINTVKLIMQTFIMEQGDPDTTCDIFPLKMGPAYVITNYTRK